MSNKTVIFPSEKSPEFFSTVRARVRDYFKDNKISKHANTEMILKTITMLLIYFVPYFLIITGVVTNSWLAFLMYIIMAIGMGGIGFSIMHDANHGAYSGNKTTNKYVGLMINFVGGFAVNWKIQHNVLHHSFTNIDGKDEDIYSIKALRFSPHQERLGIHKYQHIYAWFFYSLMTILWITTKDITQIKRYKEMNLTRPYGSYGMLLFKVILSKVFYYIYMLVIPIMLSPIIWWKIVLFFIIMHLVAGLILAMVFQPAHVVPTTEYPMPDETGKMDNNWAIHQMLTTSDFGHKSKLFSWYVGGLNHQIEHHLFPNVCHIHYKKLAKIIKRTADEYGVPYNYEKSFWAALTSHTRMLKQLGNGDILVPNS